MLFHVCILDMFFIRGCFASFLSLVFSCVSSFNFSLVSRLVLSLVLSFCLRVLLWLLLWCVVSCVWCVLCCVLCLVSCVLWCDTLNPPPRVSVQNVTVRTGNTRTCFYTCARGAGTHGDILNGHTGSVFSVSHHNKTQHTTTHHNTQDTTQHSSPKSAHAGLSRASEVHQKQALDLTHFQFENRSRTTCYRFLQSFAVPEGNKLSGT